MGGSRPRTWTRRRRHGFDVSATGVSGGGITASVATVTTRITFAAPYVGKTGAVFVTAWVPVSGLAALGLAPTLSAQLSVTSSRDAQNRPRNGVLWTEFKGRATE